VTDVNLVNGFAAVLQGLLILSLAPALFGLFGWFRARLQLRPGAGPLQTYRDLAKLLGKPGARWRSTDETDGLRYGSDFIVAATPVVVCTCYVTVALMMPIFTTTTVLPGDFLFLVYVLAIGRFALVLAGFASGTSFGGLGSSREMYLQVLAEPVLLLIIAALSLHWGSTSISIIATAHAATGWQGYPELAFLTVAMMLVALSECGRLPIDNPSTHLELTMAQRAILLEYAGRDLALIEYGEMVKLTVVLTMLANLFIVPLARFSAIFGTLESSDAVALFTFIATVLIALVLVSVKIVVLLIGLGVWELRWPKLRLLAAFQPNLVAAALALVAIGSTVARITVQGS
jgi:formate hydrogenlyase subunit 4